MIWKVLPVGMLNAHWSRNALLEQLRPTLSGNSFDGGAGNLKAWATVTEYRSRRVLQRPLGDQCSRLRQGDAWVLLDIDHVAEAALAGGLRQKFAQGDSSGRAAELWKIF